MIPVSVANFITAHQITLDSRENLGDNVGMKQPTSRSRRVTPGNPALAVAIIRVSTEDQNLGADAQRAAIDRWAAANSVQVVAYHEDRLCGASAVEDRPGLLAALADIRANHAGVLVAAKRDRIARDVVVAATIERLVADAGARIITADGVTAADTPEGQLMRGLLDLFSQYERAVIRARIKAALAVKRSRGGRIANHASYGTAHSAGQVVPNPAEAAAVARIIKSRLAGKSLRAIVKELNADGVTCRGQRWHLTTVARIVNGANAANAATNPANAA